MLSSDARARADGAGFADLIFVSMENWDEIWRRNQFLCSDLARRFPDTRILFVGLDRNVAHSLRRRQAGELFRRPETAPGHPNITLFRPLRFAPNSRAWGRRFNEAFLRAQVRRAARRLGLGSPLLWLNPYYAAHMAGKMGECAVLYDITDDWELATLRPEEKALIVTQDRLLCRRADLVVVCSEALEQSRRPLCKRILLLPNGVDPEHYRAVGEARPGGGDRRWPAPVFGYTGTLHPDRVDAELLRSLARAFPAGSVVLVGPDHLDDEIRDRLKAEANIHRMGPVPYARVPECMAEFDVCIVPHKESAFTESLNPIKLWEYLAAGKPVVSTNVAGFRDYAHLCRIATGAEAFVAACSEALREEQGAPREARRAEAERHSWRSRVDCLLSALEASRILPC